MASVITAAQRTAAAAQGIVNVPVLADVCQEASWPFYFALAILEKESGGRNVYGHDAGGALAGFPGDVSEGNFAVFRWLVKGGQTSNGVGPFQLTYPGFFDDMDAHALRPWDVRDNMWYAVQHIMRPRYTALHKSGKTVADSFADMATAYNGSPAYGQDALVKARKWFGIVGGVDAPSVRL